MSTRVTLIDSFELRVRAFFDALSYRHYGICGDCGASCYVGRNSGREPWRCVDCLDRHLARRGGLRR